jgi:class 3 adenylate cyclase
MLDVMTCAVCGRPLPDDARFCPGCGASVASSLGTDERKIVTVLFADLVDSTGLAQRIDAERAREVLGRFYDAATQELLNLRGRPEKFIGDAVMAVFGLNQVHEDDALRAVRAGLAIRERAHRLRAELGLEVDLEVRVGIDTGEAATGTGPSEQLLVTGSVVNAAARMQNAAAPGEVLVGDTAHSLTKSAVSFGEPREVEAKGFDERLRVHPVLGLTTRSVRRTIPFVGHGPELTSLRESFHRVIERDAPTLVTITGQAGMGKTRLADELIAGLEPGVSVLHGHAQVPMGSASFAPVAAIVRQLAGIDENDPPDRVTRRLRELVDGCCDASESERIAAGLGLSLGLAEPGRDESAFIDDVQNASLRLVDGLSSGLPVVLEFEDAHQLAAPMLDLIERLAAEGRQGPALVLVLARPELHELRPGWGKNVSDHVEIGLVPLSPDDAVELVRQAGGDRIDPREAGEIADRAAATRSSSSRRPDGCCARGARRPTPCRRPSRRWWQRVSTPSGRRRASSRGARRCSCRRSTSTRYGPWLLPARRSRLGCPSSKTPSCSTASTTACLVGASGTRRCATSRTPACPSGSAVSCTSPWPNS